MKVNALIVLGMHRSGTSLLTGLLAQLGICMGKKLYAAQKDVNEKGFWEHSDITDTHDQLLLSLASQWDDLLPLQDKWWKQQCIQPFIVKLDKLVKRDFLSSPLWALKDPRMCRILPAWWKIFQNNNMYPSFICMNRNPFEVVSSLQKRDHFTQNKALLLWLNHTLLAERYSRNKPRVFIEFDQVLDEPLSVMKKIESSLELNFPISIQDAKDNIEQFVSPGLRHHKKVDNIDENYTGLTSMAYRLNKILNLKTMGDESSLKEIDNIYQEFLMYQKKWPEELVEHIKSINNERADYRIKFFQIYTAWSWILVKPLWLIERLLRKY